MMEMDTIAVRVDMSLDGQRKALRQGYSDLSRREITAMLVHCTYFRDVDSSRRRACLRKGAQVLGYEDERAESYGKLFWEPMRWEHMPDESKLKELGIAFFRLKRGVAHPQTKELVPRLVIALRGTLPYRVRRDVIADDGRILVELLDESSRVRECQNVVRDAIDHFLTAGLGSEDDICLAGHSLGAGIALQVGKRFALSERVVDTHLFAPPWLTVASFASGKFLPKRIRPEKVTNKLSKFYAYLVEKMEEVKTGSSDVERVRRREAVEEEWARFEKLSGWVPSFYLNEDDVVCLQYIDYYKELIGKQEAATRETIAISDQGRWTRLFGGNAKYMVNVVPSANLHISRKYCDKSRLKIPHPKVHSLRQWHKFTEDHIGLEKIEARLLRPHSPPHAATRSGNHFRPYAESGASRRRVVY